MCRHLAFAGFAHAVTLDGLGENDGRLALVIDRCGVRGKDLVRVMSAALQAPDIVVGHGGHHFFEFRVLAEKMFAYIGAVTRLVVLVLAVQRFHHAALQQAISILGQQWVPIATPDRFDHVPARAAEIRFKFLNNFAVATHRPIEALQIAIDHEDQIIETFTSG